VLFEEKSDEYSFYLGFNVCPIYLPRFKSPKIIPEFSNHELIKFISFFFSKVSWPQTKFFVMLSKG
jgi:hypothetical protein